MKSVFFILTLVISFSLIFNPLLCSAESNYKIRVFDTKSNKNVGLEKMINKFSKKMDVIFVGEIHDDKVTHMIESIIFEKLNEENQIWDLSMEMFERDIQDVINAFLQGVIDEKTFLKLSRAWPNYKTDYKPLVEYAKENQLKLIAANIPRKYASLIAKGGFEAINKLTQSQKEHVTTNLYAPKNRYYRKFKKTMSAMRGHSKDKSKFNKMIYNIYKAQCSKDNTMAESIYKHLKNNNKRKVVHYNGKFHSDSFLGTVKSLKKYNRKLKIGVISIIPFEDKIPLRLKKEDRKLGNFVIYCKRLKLTQIKSKKMFKLK